MSTSTAAPFDVRLSYGPLLVGVFFNMILFGVLIVQVCGLTLPYAPKANTDVWGVFFVETANTAFDMSIMYEPLILHYGAPPDKLPTVFVTQPLCVVLVGFPIQLFFIWRIYALTANKFIAGCIFLCALTSFGGGAWTTVLVPIVGRFSRIPTLYRSAGVWLISSAVTDICIASTLAVSLWSKKTGWGMTDTVVNTLIRMTVQTGVLTALFSILDVVCFLTLRGRAVNFFFNIALSKLYSNSLMSTLNARRYLRRTLDAQPAVSLEPVPGNEIITDGEAFEAPNADKVNAVQTFVQSVGEGGSQYQIDLTEIDENIAESRPSEYQIEFAGGLVRNQRRRINE
ncbi:hypothetical protein B0H12DRAFT_1231895 [Mycena haematopus]|nr:hypothetical protein B0H12DRAFT_1231895 [Mycena haematopus]